MLSIMEQAFPFYKIEEVDLKDGAEPISKDLVGLIITQPRKDYSEKELRRIDEFLMTGGKSLVVYASAVTLKPNDASMSAELNTHGLDKLLTGYGIQINKDAVLDFGAQFRIGVPTQGGVAWIRHPGIAHVINDPRLDDDEKALDTSFPAFFRMDEVIMPFPSSLKLLRDKQPADVKLAAVARTTPDTSVDKSDTVDMKLREEWKQKPPQEQRVIAAYRAGQAEERLRGFARRRHQARRPRPERVARARGLVEPLPLEPVRLRGQRSGPRRPVPDVRQPSAATRTLQMIAQPYTKYLTSTILSFKNTLDWMAGDSDLIAASAKLIGDPNLTYTSVAKPKIKDATDEAELKRKDEEYRNARKALQNKVQWTLILGMPSLFGAFGLFRWRRREANRDRYKI